MLTKFRPPDLAAQNGRIDEIRMIPNVVKHPNRNSPPKLGGVAARSIKSREATLFRADGVVLGLGTTPSRLMKRRRATPPNLGGEFLFGCFALVHPEFPQIRKPAIVKNDMRLMPSSLARLTRVFTGDESEGCNRVQRRPGGAGYRQRCRGHKKVPPVTLRGLFADGLEI